VVEAKTVGDIVKYETPFDYGRKVITIKQVAAATAGLPIGQLLEDAATKAVAVATGADCDAVLLEEVALADLKAGDTSRVALVKGPAVIDADNVTVAAAQKDAALAALSALGIVSRVGPTYTVGA